MGAGNLWDFLINDSIVIYPRQLEIHVSVESPSLVGVEAHEWMGQVSEDAIPA